MALLPIFLAVNLQTPLPSQEFAAPAQQEASVVLPPDVVPKQPPSPEASSPVPELVPRPGPVEDAAPTVEPEPLQEAAPAKTPAAQAARGETSPNLGRGVLASLVMLGAEAAFLPVAAQAGLAPAYLLNALLIIPATAVSLMAASTMADGALHPEQAGAGLWSGANVALASLFPGFGSVFQGICLGPAALITLPALMVCSLPFVAGAVAVASRNLTHKSSLKDSLLAGARAWGVTALVAWPLGGLVLLGAAAAGLVWAAGSQVLVSAYAVETSPYASSADERRASDRRLNSIGPVFLNAGMAMAGAVGVVALLGALVLPLNALWPLVEQRLGWGTVKEDPLF